MQKRSITAVAVTATTVLASALTATASAAPASHAVAHTKPAWTAKAKHLGHASNSSGVHARVYLTPRGGMAALRQAALGVSTPGSASYRKFLTAAQYHQRYATTDTTVHSVSSYLRHAGLKVTGVGAHNRYVTISGNVANAEKAFGASIDRYRHAGRNVQAPASDLKVPASLASSVLTVSGLDTSPSMVKPATKQAAPPPAGFHNARPCSLSYGAVSATYKADFKTPLPKFKGKTLPYAVCGYTGPQFRAAYEGNTNLDGSGVSVGIVDAYAAPTIRGDSNRYATLHGDGSYASGQYSQTLPAKFTHQKVCDPSGWYGEQTLDVEAVHAMAPGANIHFYAASSCFNPDFVDAIATLVDENKVQIVSNSYGTSEEGENATDIAGNEQNFLQGAMEGISFVASSGDNGDELANTGLRQADYPASDPYVTAVGGTSTAIVAGGKLDFQTGWGTEKYSLSADSKSWTLLGFIYGAGGGPSALFNKPSYQNGVAPGPYRQVPDVAMDADPTTGMLIGETQTFADGVRYDEYRIGGTSLASPLYAGMTALAFQHAGHSVGLLNPTIYKNRATAYTDVKGTPKDAGNVRVDYANGIGVKGGLLYSVRTFNQDSSLKVTPGWDSVTGVGVPNPTWLTAIK